MCDNSNLLLIYRNRIRDIEASLKRINRLINEDSEYIDSHPYSINWSYLDKAYKLRQELLKIEHKLK